MPFVTILFFASLKEITGRACLELELPEHASVGDLRNRLKQEFQSASQHIDTAVFSINREFAFDEDVIPEHAEIGVFPPVSGGTSLPTVINITHEVLDMNALVDQIITPRHGAACIFTGLVRGITSREDAHLTDHLLYEAYEPMAEAKMLQVAEEIRQRWPAVEGIAIVQRIGQLEPMTPTVMIACTAAHRDTGVFEAARYGIDRLKEIVPIWKKEIGPDGEEWIEGDYHPGEADR